MAVTLTAFCRLLSLATLAQDGLSLAPSPRAPRVAASQELSRRAALALPLGLAAPLIAPRAARAIADDSPAPDATFVRVPYGPGSVEMPSTWKCDKEAISETVLGSITSSVRAHAAPTTLNSMADFGRIEKVPLSKLDLLGARATGDFVTAKQRTDLSGQLFYEWDLAVPPPNGCSRADQEVVVCQPVEVALITATVYDGKLVVFECGVDRAQWKNFGRQLRTMRSTFSTTEPTSA